MGRALVAAAMLLGLAGQTSAHLSAVCTTTSKQQPNTFAFWFITYGHRGNGPGTKAPGQVHIRDPSGRDIVGEFGDACWPTGSLPGGSGQTVDLYENIMKTQCLGLSDSAGNVPVFSDSSVECYNADTNSPLPNYALGVRGSQPFNVGYGLTQTEWYFVILDNQFVETGSYVTHFTGVDETLDACDQDWPCELFREPWTFEVSVITGPPRCLTAPPPSLVSNTVASSLSGCDGSSSVIEAGMLCHAQCLSGYGKVGVLECIDNGDGTASWNPSFQCSSEALCSVPDSGNTGSVTAQIKGVLPPCEALTPAGTACQYTCTGFGNQLSAGKIRCEADPMHPTQGYWVPDADYDGCAWTPEPTAAPVPDTWELGCYIDEDVDNRVLPDLEYVGGGLTFDMCVTKCNDKGMAYAGVEFGTQCFCGNSLAGALRTISSDCEQIPCSGDGSVNCGGGYRLKVFGYSAPAAAHTPMLEGCYEDEAAARRLPHLAFVDATHTTNAECAAVCQARGYAYSGTQAGKECRCGNDLSTSKRINLAACNSPCAGDSSTKCGGAFRNTVYSLAAMAAPFTPVLEGCFYDDEAFALAYSSSALTVAECTKTCQHNGFTYAALQGGDECHCTNDISATRRTTITQCRGEPCTGNPSEWCGAAHRNEIYAVASTPAKPAATYLGCFRDNVSSSRKLPVMTYDDRVGNTIDECTKACLHNGFTYAGLQYGRQCWCGNVHSGTGALPDRYCNMACPGATSTKCGGGWKNSVYQVVP